MNNLLRKNFPTYYKIHKNQSGIVFITVLLVGLLLTFIGLSMANVAILQFRRTSDNVFISNAFLSAEAGIEQSLYQLNNDNNFTGFATDVTFFDEDSQGRGTYQTTIADSGSGNEKIVTSIGRVYRSSGVLVSERKVKVSIVGTQSTGYSVFTGPGGLILSNNATLTSSDVFVNGFITMSNNAQIGTSAQPRNVNVANYNCPSGSNPGSSYPQLCTSGQPITINNNAKIYGTVCATNQTNSNGILPGSGGLGLVSGCTAPQTQQPSYDRSAHIARMSPLPGYSSSNSAYTCTGSNVKTWPANLRLNGNVSLSNNCVLTISGDVYITGNFSANNNTTIRIADSLGTNRPKIVVDGNISINNNATFIANSSGTGAHFITYKGSGSCNLAATCSGTDLKNSQSMQTISLNNNGSSPGVIFQAYWSKVNMANNGVSGAVIGQTVEFSNSGNLVLGTVLSSGTNTWTIRSYQYDY